MAGDRGAFPQSERRRDGREAQHRGGQEGPARGGGGTAVTLARIQQAFAVVIESWRRHYNTIRPHASIGYKPPAPEVFVPAFAAWPAALRRPAPPATLAQRPTLN